MGKYGHLKYFVVRVGGATRLDRKQLVAPSSVFLTTLKSTNVHFYVDLDVL